MLCVNLGGKIFLHVHVHGLTMEVKYTSMAGKCTSIDGPLQVNPWRQKQAWCLLHSRPWSLSRCTVTCSSTAYNFFWKINALPLKNRVSCMHTFILKHILVKLMCDLGTGTLIMRSPGKYNACLNSNVKKLTFDFLK